MTFWSDHCGIIYGVRTNQVYELIQDLPYLAFKRDNLFHHMMLPIFSDLCYVINMLGCSFYNILAHDKPLDKST